jgi:hypothetical protein
LLLFVLQFSHVLACLWIFIALREEYSDDPQTWIYVNDFNVEDPFHLYVFSFYWILETVTTVGYGDYSGSTNTEMIFSMAMEFIGLIFFSSLMGSINSILNKKDTFEDLIDEKLGNLNVWIKKLERSN